MRPAHKQLAAREARSVAEALVVAGVALLVAVLVYHAFSRAGLTTPFDMQADSPFHTSIARSLQLHGWYTPTAELGAPNGQNLLDFPLGGDHLHIVGLLVLAKLGLSPYTAVNVALLLTYATTAGSCHLVLRRIGILPGPAAVASILFAFLPYHAHQGQAGHLFLAGYFAIPLLLILVHWLIADGLLSRRPARLSALAIIVVVAGSSSAYYAIFIGMLLGVAGVFETIRRRQWQPLLAAMTVSGAIALMLAVNLAPNLLHMRSEGSLPELARQPAEAEIYALRPAAMVLPGAFHRLPAFARVGKRVAAVAEPSEDGSYLGVIGDIGLLALLGAVLCRGAGSRINLPPLLSVVGALTVVTVFLGVKAGGGFVLSQVGLSEIRAWGRLSLVIGLFALTAIAMALERVPTRFRAAALVVVLVFGLADQIPLYLRGSQPANQAAVESDRAFVDALHSALPDRSLLYQLPYMRFPENGPIVALHDYELLRPVLADSGRFRWSYGAVKGRDVWQEPLVGLPPDRLAQVVADAGFAALVVHRLGYADRGAAIDAALGPLVGASSGESLDGSLRWYDLRRLATPGIAVSEAITNPPPMRWSDAQPQEPSYPASRLLGPRVVIQIDSGRQPRQLRLLGRVDAPGRVTVEAPGAPPHLASDGRLDIAFTAPAGRSEITIVIDGPSIASPGDTRDLRGRATGVWVVDEAAADLVSH